MNDQQKSLSKIDNWLNALIYEEGGKMNAGSLRTIELIRKEAGNILRHESLSKVQVDYYEDKIEMLQRLIAERDKTIANFNEPIKDEELDKKLHDEISELLFYNIGNIVIAPTVRKCVEVAKKYTASKLNNTIDDKWISVEEEYPKQYGNYLVQFITTVGEIEICVASFNEIPRHIFENPEMDKRWFVYPSAGHEIKPTHWQLLPKSSKI